MKPPLRIFAFAVITFLAACTSPPPRVGMDTPKPPLPGLALVWADEFETDGLPDPQKWAYDTDENKNGWYNGEQQYYSAARPENSRIENGILIIEARKETLDPTEYADWGGQEYTSARLLTRGLQAWTYGYFEVRAKLACGNGAWPAIWTLPEEMSQWPDDGEIDIMEHVGQTPGTVHATVHTRDYNHVIGNQATQTIHVEDACTEFHTYHLWWEEDTITIGVDGENYYTYRDNDEGEGAWPFNRPHYLILNVAVGGWASPVDPDSFPTRMEVDYVRIWQKR